MARSSSSGVGEGIASLFVYWWIVRGLASWLNISWWLAAFYLVMLGILVFSAWSLVRKVRKQIELRRVRAIRCVHGLERNGISCEQCLELKAAGQRRRELIRNETEKLELIKAEAALLRREENKRLASLWRMQPSSYFDMHHRDFEDAICDVFRRLGYDAVRTPFSKDGGKDGILTKDGQKLVLECKRYSRKGKTGRPELQILLAAMMDEGADGAIFVTTGSFTSDAIEYARSKKLKLYDRESLPLLVNNAYGTPEQLDAKTMCLSCGEILIQRVTNSINEAICLQGHRVVCDLTISSLNQTSPSERSCTLCSFPMRVVRHGTSSFWGCSKYPACRYRESIPARSHRKFRRNSRYSKI
jgi:HJR/Mrr/RecB family endonuclease